MSYIIYILLLFSFSSFAEVDTFSISEYKYPAIYPFVAKSPRKIYSDVKKVTEDPNFVKNFFEIEKLSLLSARTNEQPWTGSYWPLSKGTIADPFEDSKIPYYLDIKWVTWRGNYKRFIKRKKKVLANIDSLTERELAKLAPSEKYDLLLGDKDFDLTTRLWEYMEKWGSAKENSFITNLILIGENSLNLANEYVANNWYSSVEDAFINSWNLKPTLSAENSLILIREGRYENAIQAFHEALLTSEEEAGHYVLAKKNSLIAGWEGICNGWATAAGLTPRPRKTVYFNLEDGRKLKFYPSDIRGLVSLYWVNSLIQDPAFIGQDGLPKTQGTVSAGLRCNLSNPGVDIWGRPYDDSDDPFNRRINKRRDSRCSGVHPATWHLGLVNLIGKQKRSFIVERKVGDAVDNHPMFKYEMSFFHPNNGKTFSKTHDNLIKIDENDQFKQLRHPLAKYIVGVDLTYTYMDYIKPIRREQNNESHDKLVDKNVYYDLELDQNYNIIGGQWRAYKIGLAPLENNHPIAGNNTMPDFFWAITKDYKDTGWFGDRSDIENWSDVSKAPPQSWLKAAKQYHSFQYNMTVDNGLAQTCKVTSRKYKKNKEVLCEQSYNRPQPFINIINQLITLSR